MYAVLASCPKLLKPQIQARNDKCAGAGPVVSRSPFESVSRHCTCSPSTFLDEASVQEIYWLSSACCLSLLICQEQAIMGCSPNSHCASMISRGQEHTSNTKQHIQHELVTAVWLQGRTTTRHGPPLFVHLCPQTHPAAHGRKTFKHNRMFFLLTSCVC